MFSRILFALAFSVIVPNALVAEPIHDAATGGDAELVRRLLIEGTPVDQFDTTDSFGRPTTALYRATMAGRIDVVDLLLEAGADPTLRADDSRSVLHPMQVAAKFGRVEILQKFLDQGADPNAPGKESTALHLALKSEKPDVANRLLDAGALPGVEQPSIVGKLAAGDPERGREVFVSTCRYCHREPRQDEKPTAKDRIASLWDIVGREIASLEGAIYSDALMDIDGVWTYDRLNSFVALPGGFVPGTLMEYYLHYTPPDEQGRIDLISYLRTLSDDPVPLPE